MDNSFIAEMTKEDNMMSFEQQINIYHLLSRVVLLNIPGDIVEFGCHKGLTTAIMQKTLDQLGSKKQIHVYDSFDGLPEMSKKDKGPVKFSKGDLKVGEKDLIKTFKKYKLKLPKINKYWFNEIPKEKLPKKISFAHFDGDFYSSTIDGLKKIYPLLSKGAILIIDDYCDIKIHRKIEKSLNENKWSNNPSRNRVRKYFVRELFPGVKKACDEFFSNKKEKVSVLVSGDKCHGYIIKK